jgi:hypothetical protein
MRDGRQLAQVSTNIGGELVDYDELTKQRVEDRSEVLRFEGGATPSGGVNEQQRTAIRRKFRETIYQERRPRWGEEIIVFLRR